MASASANPVASDAHEELNDLIQTLHEQGLLRLANDLAASHSQWLPALGEIIGDAIDAEQLRHTGPALAEIARLLQALHQQGLLHFANDVVSFQGQWAPALREIFEDSVNVEQLRNAVPALVELSELVQTLYRQGVLQIASDMAASYPEIIQTLGEISEDYLNNEDTRKALQNLSVGFTALLSRIEPNQLGRLLMALSDSLEEVAEHKPEAAAPGLMGLYRMTKDESLWRGLAPVIEGLKVFATGLEKTSKQTSAPSGGSRHQ